MIDKDHLNRLMDGRKKGAIQLVKMTKDSTDFHALSDEVLFILTY